MKILLQFMLIGLLTLGCSNPKKTEPEPDSKLKQEASDFDLKADITDFKKKMTELDTLNLWFSHSVCTYEGYEKIEITKKADSLKIRTEYKEVTFEDNPKWKVVYEKQIPETDTIWKIEEFFKRNDMRLNSDEKEYGTLQVINKGTKLHYFTHDLVDLNRFMKDFYDTMKKLHPENKDGIYGVEYTEIQTLTDESEIK